MYLGSAVQDSAIGHANDVRIHSNNGMPKLRLLLLDYAMVTIEGRTVGRPKLS